MKPLAVLVLTAVVAFAGCGGGASSVNIGSGLKGPSGTAATAYATGMPKVAALAFDDAGRLWASTADYSDTGADAVYLIASRDASATPVITGLHTPLGLLWYQQSLYVASKEKIEAYAGFDGTTFASHTTVVALPAGVGEVNGIVLAPNGRMQVGISAPCDHCTPTLELSGAVISFLPDGRDVQVDAKAIRAPIGLAYVSGTNDLLVTMNQRDDLGDNTPGDWLSFVAHGQSWGFPDCYGQGGAACTNVPAPVAVLDKHAAVSGVTIWNGDAVVAEWTTGKVLRVALTKTESGYTGKVSTLIDGISNPVGVAVSPSNALFVGDWDSGTVFEIAKP